jgi:hypothetical protein
MLPRNSIVILSAILITVAIFPLGACSQATPVAIDLSEINVNPDKTVLINEEISLSVNASGSNLQFKWTVEKGRVSSSDKPSIIYTAPNSPGSDTVTVEVLSGDVSKFRSIAINIVAPTSTPLPTPVWTPTARSTETPTVTPTVTPTPTDIPIIVATEEPPTETPTSTSTPPPTNTPIPPEPPRPPCEGDTSEVLVAQVMEARTQGDYEKALSCIYEVELRWSEKAREQQMEKEQSDCKYTPDPNDQAAMQDFWGKYWALNDVGLSLFMRGEILREQGKCSAGRESYETVIKEYSCSYGWDPRNWYWSVAEGADAGLKRQCP